MSFDALLLDAAGTLIHVREPVAVTYARLGERFGFSLDPDEIARRFKLAMRIGIPQIGDGRPFWREVVRIATGVEDQDYFEALYAHFGRGDAWVLAPGADRIGPRLATRLRVAVVSNWDTRLRGVLGDLGVTGWVREVVGSGEVGLSKPDPAIFQLACARLGVAPDRAVHVGDDPADDVAGALAAGCTAWLWARDVVSMAELERRLTAATA